MINGIDFEQHIKAMGDRELSEYIARTVYQQNTRCNTEMQAHSERIKALEDTTSGKKSAITGAATGGGLSVIIGLIEYFIHR